MTKKLEKLEEQHQLEKYQLLTDEEKQKRHSQALIFVGGIHAVGKIARTLGSQELRAIEAVQSERIYLDLGFEKFVDFLNSELSPITKSQYYERSKLIEKEGDQVFDLLNEVGISLRTRKMLAQSNYGEVVIDGDKIKVGEDEADLSDLKMVKTLIEQFSNDCRKLTEKTEKQKESIEKLEETIELGKVELEEKQRALDDAKTSSYDKAYTTLLLDFVKLTEEAKKTDIDDSRREADLRSVFGQMLNFKDTLKPDFVLFDESASAQIKLDPDVKQLLSEDDDWGDDNE